MEPLRSGTDADVLVLGAGVAGLSAALAAAEEGARVLVTAKAGAAESATRHAQGGVAVALGPGDSPEAHERDTLDVGCGLNRPEAVRRLVTEGPARVRELISWGANFDREGGSLAFTTEGGHTRARVVHAAGDATGREVEEVLLEAAREERRITIRERVVAADLLLAGSAVRGAACLDADDARPFRLRAPAVILATGGAGQVYRETTNPEVATGDGIAMACRAGAAIADMEFVQFHPTTLYLAGAKRFLISEAVRGEGGIVVNGAGERFLARYDARGELAPRDIVSRAIVMELARTGEAQAWLDLSGIPEARRALRFPGILAVCADYGLDARRERIPIRPAAHYLMGGVVTDLDGRTNVPGLFACGETACTGVHGANRLASNSLLEGLVFGRAAGAAAAREARRAGTAGDGEPPADREPRRMIPLDVEDVVRSLKSLMWRAAGVVRRGEELAAAMEQLRFWRRYAFEGAPGSPRGLALRNMLLVAELTMRAALDRRESRGAHYRVDYPERDDAGFGRSRLAGSGLDM